METATVLGIEAARTTIVKQIDHTMSSHGLGVDPRHTGLLGDVMTYKVSLCRSILISCAPITSTDPSGLSLHPPCRERSSVSPDSECPR